MTLAGHSNITTTRQYYLTVRPENMASASKIINKMLQETKSGLTQIAIWPEKKRKP
jgi:hypothetical protein